MQELTLEVRNRQVIKLRVCRKVICSTPWLVILISLHQYLSCRVVAGFMQNYVYSRCSAPSEVDVRKNCALELEEG